MEGTMSEIRMFAGNYAPKDWALCQGQAMAINTNQALFALLGNTYGGDGITNFMLPNLAGRTAMGTGIGVGTKVFQLGMMVGTETVTCDIQHMPAHTHATGSEAVSIKTSSNQGNTGSPAGSALASLDGLYSSDQPDSSMRPLPNNTLTLSISGAGQPINIRQPYLGINYIICTYGIFPSRS
ncbi:tail fiber protein [Chryseobacterium sp. SSA4.19]|uniref:phage tail protein n=1 Tax=Chryseobacterium sp. SSA4.19 TaxID=2919915 RepID=UPI001F4DFB1F|nr:tail fiber protein [Chryseobacterium sp. SSA4.19]MCJ8155749.1 tail fiber protein [Chryseobacterium sp. SSA4.19]